VVVADSAFAVLCQNATENWDIALQVAGKRVNPNKMDDQFFQRTP
jgi:hypothetical protein